MEIFTIFDKTSDIFEALRPVYENRPSISETYFFTYELSQTTLLSMGSLSSVEIEPTRCLGGHRFDSSPGLRFFLRPTLVTCCMMISEKQISPQKPRFESANFKFYRRQIPKASKMKTIPS